MTDEQGLPGLHADELLACGDRGCGLLRQRLAAERIARREAYRWAADWMRALAADQRASHRFGTIGDWERLADRIEAGPTPPTTGGNE